MMHLEMVDALRKPREGLQDQTLPDVRHPQQALHEVVLLLEDKQPVRHKLDPHHDHLKHSLKLVKPLLRRHIELS